MKPFGMNLSTDAQIFTNSRSRSGHSRFTRLSYILKFRAVPSLAIALVATSLAVGNKNEATAYGDTRSISLYYTHTKDTLNITFKRNGYYDRDALKQLNYFLRDWRRDEPTTMDPKLFDTLWEVYREAGREGETINVVSAYRAPETNAMLRRRSRAVAKHSQHTMGKAMDTTMPGVSMAKIREIGIRLQRGGVGYYPTAGTPFVHLDVGSVRAWPRMNTSQLLNLFPDQRTVHLPSDGPPLAGYQEALAEIERNGGSVGGGGDEDEGGGNLFAILFGGGSSNRGRSQTAGRSGNTQVASVSGASGDDTGSRSFFVSGGAPQGSSEAPARGRVTRVKVQSQTPQSVDPVQSKDVPQPAQVQLASARPQPVEEPALASTGAPPAKALAIAEDSSIANSPSNVSLIPMPPRRPNDLMLLAGLPLTNIPMPPLRPVELGQTQVAALATTKAEPEVPVLASAALASADRPHGNVPLPPIITGRVPVKANALGFAPVEVPMPPLRVASAGQPASIVTRPQPVKEPQAHSPALQASRIGVAPKPGGTKTGAVTLAALMSDVALKDSNTIAQRVDTPQVNKQVQSGIVATRFETASVPKLESGKFTTGLTPKLGASFVKSSSE